MSMAASDGTIFGDKFDAEKTDAFAVFGNPYGPLKTNRSTKNYTIYSDLDEAIKANDIDTTYIDWLEEFTEKYPQFSNNIIYKDIILSNDDKKQITKLNLLYRYIEEYAFNNSIYGVTFNKNCIYLIKHNNIGYKIGNVMHTTEFFCKRTEAKGNFIDFKDIKLCEEKKQSDSKKDKLIMLSELIHELIKENISADEIKNTTEKTLKKVLYINKD